MMLGQLDVREARRSIRSGVAAALHDAVLGRVRDEKQTVINLEGRRVAREIVTQLSRLANACAVIPEDHEAS